MTDDTDIEILPAIRSGLSHGEKAELDAILSEFTPRQLDFLQARLHTETDAAAAEITGVGNNTVNNNNVKPKINRAIFLMRKATLIEGHMVAVERMARLIPAAIKVLEDSLESPLPWLRRQAAIDVLQYTGITQASALAQDTRPIEISELAKWIATARLIDVPQNN